MWWFAGEEDRAGPAEGRGIRSSTGSRRGGTRAREKAAAEARSKTEAEEKVQAEKKQKEETAARAAAEKKAKADAEAKARAQKKQEDAAAKQKADAAAKAKAEAEKKSKAKYQEDAMFLASKDEEDEEDEEEPEVRKASRPKMFSEQSAALCCLSCHLCQAGFAVSLHLYPQVAAATAGSAQPAAKVSQMPAVPLA